MLPDAGSGEVSADPEQVGASPTLPFWTSRKTVVGEPMVPVPVMAKMPSAEAREDRRRVEAARRVVVVKCIFGVVGRRCAEICLVYFGCSCEEVEFVADNA
jgi:hypothetical protein